MRYFSLFSGVGGFEIGISNAYDSNISGRSIPKEIPERKGSEDIGNRLHSDVNDDTRCVGFSEIDRHASAVLRYRFPNVTNYGDITKIDWSAVPDFDLLVGGSPCQSFSVAGKRAGFSGASGLYFEYLRALREKKPAHFIWENVKGVLSSNGGRDFARILDTMAEAGYSLWWQVLNARDFGVPQNRERVFVVGTRSDVGSPREIFFETGTGGKESPLKYVGTVSSRDWSGDGKNLSRNSPQGSRIYDESGIMPALAKETGGHGIVSGLINQLNDPRHSNDRVYGTDGISPTLNTMQGGMRQPFVPDGTRIRRLMPVECERLMSWPDDWTRYGDYGGGTKEISDTQRYKMCGNGVVSKVVEAVIKAHLL